jgi:hypothetical protein
LCAVGWEQAAQPIAPTIDNRDRTDKRQNDRTDPRQNDRTDRKPDRTDLRHADLVGAETITCRQQHRATRELYAAALREHGRLIGEAPAPQLPGLTLI